MIVLIIILLLLIIFVSVIIILFNQKNAFAAFGNNIIISDEVMTIDQDKLTKEAYDSTRHLLESNVGLLVYNSSLIRKKYGYLGITRGETYNYDCSTKKILNRIIPSFNYPLKVKLIDKQETKDEYSVSNPEPLFPHEITVKSIDIDYSKMNFFREHGLLPSYEGLEDGRIFVYEKKNWVSCTVIGHKTQIPSDIPKIAIFRLKDPNNTFRILNVPEGIDSKKMQKNWCMFQYGKELYCSYSINPHIVLKIDMDTGNTSYVSYSAIEERNIRGSSAHVKISDKYYLGVGHINLRGHYFHCFFLFETEPPFQIVAITPFSKIDGRERIQFVNGLSTRKGMVYVSYGVDDNKNRISKISFDKMLEMMNSTAKKNCELKQITDMKL